MSLNTFVVEAIRERLAALHHASVMATARGIIRADAEILDRLATA